jgi:endoglucanase
VAVVTIALVAGNGCNAEQKHWPLWESYAKAFVDDQGRVIDHSVDDRTTSESEAYALFFALVAGDHAHFDKILAWTRDNLAQGDLNEHLPSWNWGKRADGSWGPLDTNSASDADLWLAYDLLEAGRLWNEPSYTETGSALANRIASSEVAYLPANCAGGPVLMPAPMGFHNDDLSWTVNPSYAPPFLLEYMAESFPRGPWKAMVGDLPQVYNRINASGYAPDWVQCSATSGWNTVPSPGGDKNKAESAKASSEAQGTPAATAAPAPAPGGVGSFDALRVYLWLGIADAGTPGVQQELESLPGMAEYLKDKPVPPMVVDSTGAVKNVNGGLCFSAALVPYLSALGKHGLADVQHKRLADSLDAPTGLYGHPPLYYDQNMALFAYGWLEKRYRLENNGRLKLKWK